MTFEIHLADAVGEGGDWVRVVDFRVGTGRWARFLPTIDNKRPLPEKMPGGWSPLSEVYSRITLEKLREIDDDKDAQKDFIRRNLTPRPGTAGMPILKVLLGETDSLQPKDIEYLGHLLPPPECTLATVPLLYRYRVSEVTGRPVEGRAVEIDQYVDFAKNFVDTCSSAGARTFGLSMPFNTPHSRVPALLAAYKNVSTPVAVVDAAGGNLDDMTAQIRALLGSTKKDSYSVRQRQGEHYALYAFDTKPYRGRKEVVAAVNLLLLDQGFSGFGRRHTIHMKLPKPPKDAPKLLRPGRIAYPTELAYARDNVPAAVELLTRWWAKRGGATDDLRGALGQRRAFEQEALAGAAYRLGNWAAKGELPKRLGKRSWIQPDLARARRFNQRTLDGSGP